MPVVHSSASVFKTEGVLTGQGPSSNVSTTSLSSRKSSCLKCSKPNPGPPVVSISTVRAMPSALGFEQAGLTTDRTGFCSGIEAAISAVRSDLRSGPGAGLVDGNGIATARGVLSTGGGAGVRIHMIAPAPADTAPAISIPAITRILNLTPDTAPLGERGTHC